MKKLILLLVISLSLASAYGQDVHTTNLRWSVNGLHDLQTNATDSYDCVFETTGTGNIAWLQRNGSSVTTVTVAGVNGDWTDVAGMGSVAYDVSIDGLAGTLTFGRDAAGLFILLELAQTEGPALRHRYTVTSVNAN